MRRRRIRRPKPSGSATLRTSAVRTREPQVATIACMIGHWASSGAQSLLLFVLATSALPLVGRLRCRVGEIALLADGAGVESDGERSEVDRQRDWEVQVRLFEAFVGGEGLKDGLGRSGVRPQ